MDPPANVRLQIVLDRPVAVYSGMVPGFVAGDYALHQLEIDVLPLARRAKAGVILSAAVDLDPVRKEISLEGRPPIRFDLASLDVGSTVRGLDLPGVLVFSSSAAAPPERSSPLPSTRDFDAPESSPPSPSSRVTKSYSAARAAGRVAQSHAKRPRERSRRSSRSASFERTHPESSSPPSADARPIEKKPSCVLI